jgi:hypothetical protein
MSNQGRSARRRLRALATCQLTRAGIVVQASWPTDRTNPSVSESKRTRARRCPNQLSSSRHSPERTRRVGDQTNPSAADVRVESPFWAMHERTRRGGYPNQLSSRRNSSNEPEGGCANQTNPSVPHLRTTCVAVCERTRVAASSRTSRSSCGIRTNPSVASSGPHQP